VKHVLPNLVEFRSVALELLQSDWAGLLNTTIVTSIFFLILSYRHFNTREKCIQFSTLLTNTLAQSLLLRGEIAVCSEIYTIHINTMCGHSIEIFFMLNLAVHVATTEL